jgi:DNA integrity scanning protein DisA with diadenylate cyclase activity
MYLGREVAQLDGAVVVQRHRLDAAENHVLGCMEQAV